MKNTSNRAVSVIFIALLLLSLIPLNSVPAYAEESVCKKYWMDDGKISSSECESDGICKWCDGLGYDGLFSCIPKGESCTGRSEGTFCAVDEQCASGLKCTGDKFFANERACCPSGKYWKWSFVTDSGVCSDEPLCEDKDLDGRGDECRQGLDCDDLNPDIYYGNKEICFDSLDNDCDGRIDEGCYGSDPDTGEYGSYELGNYTSGAFCQVGICKDGDANCDGIDDPGCRTLSCTPHKEICNLKDDDCDGVVDDGCYTQCNTCGAGLLNWCDEEECSALGPGCLFKDGLFKNGCIETSTPKTAKCVEEVCNGIDDNCDGFADEGGVCDEQTPDVNVLLLIKQYRGEACSGHDECGGLQCAKSRWLKKGICCLPAEENKGGSCLDTRAVVGESCGEDDQCTSGYCSKGIHGFWRRVGGKLVPEWIKRAVTGKRGRGICCAAGTDYSAVAGSCVEGGTFTSIGDKDFCREKKDRGYACRDGEGHCQNDDECMAGSYCSQSKSPLASVCCPKGSYLDKDTLTCVKNIGKECSDCSGSKCKEDECLSLGATCTYNEGSCFERVRLGHDEGPCNADSQCYAPGEALYCAKNGERGTCCYPWETYNTKTGRCMVACSDGFCDTDGDFYNSRIELRYGANPAIPRDTPWLRLVRNDCEGPFDYEPYFSIEKNDQIVQMGIDSLTGGLIATLDSLFRGKFSDAAVGLMGNLGGIASGIVYGAADDVHFLYSIVGFAVYKMPEYIVGGTVSFAKVSAKILRSPTYISKVILSFKEKKEEAEERNPELNEQSVQEYVEAQDSSTRNDIMTAASDSAYSIDRGMWNQCSQMVHTKSFSSGFFGGYFWEQVLILGKVARVLQGAGKFAVRVGGYVVELIDNPIANLVGKPFKHFANEKNIAKLENKLTEELAGKYVKGGGAKTANALEIASILKGKTWDDLKPKQFDTIFDNFFGFKTFLKESLENSPKELKEHLRKTAVLLDTELGQTIFKTGMGKKGWDNGAVIRILNTLDDEGIKALDGAFKGASPATVKKFGDGMQKAMHRLDILRGETDILLSAAGARKAVDALENGKSFRKHLEDVGLVKKLPIGGTCFIAGTPVLTSQGSKPIEEIAVGDDVLAYDGRISTNQVVQTFEHKTDQLIEIELDGEVITTTKDHPFFVREAR